MPTYKAPVEDFKFLFHEFLQIDKRDDLPGFADLTPDMTTAILEGGAKFCEEVLQPLNQVGDEEGCTFENGVVRTPKGFKEAFQQYCEAGWNRLAAPEEYGGAGLPSVITFAFSEIGSSANQAFTMYPGLTNAAYSALAATGEPWMKEHIVPKMVSGEWCGTMCLTEPHCGTDLKLMKTKAEPQEDGTYKMNGTKIFISGGDHDMTDNIIHMVIAKIPDEDGKLHDDLSTVNFFMVPKFIVDPETGEMTKRNGVSVGSIEKKMGIKGSATCVMNFDDAVAYKLGGAPQKKSAEGGEKKKSKSAGMAGMFGMMNGARMGVGIQGIAVGEVAVQNGAAYALERRAGRALTGAKDPDANADPIIVFPDVRRLLLSSRSFVEGARALAMWVSMLFTIQQHSPDEKEREEAADLSQLLTPVIKAYFTDKGFEAANNSMQVFGGHGYVRDHGMEQFVRDARINQVYEGANGIQALDLVGRKMTMKGGKATLTFFSKIENFIKENEGNEKMKPFIEPLKTGYDRMGKAAGWLMENAPKNFDNAGAASYEMLNIFGVVSIGYMWAQMAKVALEKLEAGEGDAEFYKRKLVLAKYWLEREVPNTASYLERLQLGADTLMELDEDSFVA
ncbi:acyl-CoA dehydrogenase C-terminal domain-containing protein [Tepidicaulis sp. LMO-SS28]|uniref:acyl-CoA dehydrogenase C-terminal domain-containing protein n=1 Tax=Tepidicaulis sp. LMO-SS28 TaxID=3447455 RepID=UPI003EDFADD7